MELSLKCTNKSESWERSPKVTPPCWESQARSHPPVGPGASRIPRGLLTQPQHRSLPAPASPLGTSPGPGRRNLSLPTRAASPNKPLRVVLEVPIRVRAVRGRGKPPEVFSPLLKMTHKDEKRGPELREGALRAPAGGAACQWKEAPLATQS